MPTPFQHPDNATHWYGNVGRGKARRLKNLNVPLTEPIETAQAALDKLNDAWEGKQAAPKRDSKQPAQRPLLALFAEWKDRKTLDYRDSRRGFGNVADRVEKTITACKFKSASDIDATKILAYLDSRRGPKFSATTADHYRRNFEWFAGWLREKGYLTGRVFGRRTKIKGEMHHRRRVLTASEKRKLLDATAKGKTRGHGAFRKTGHVRHLIYLTALQTGYRSSEIQALTVSCLQGDRLKLAGEWTKNGDHADQPLPPALATLLHEHVRGRDPAERLFPKWAGGAKMLRADLKVAGIAYETPDGIADFHALRNTYCSDLIAHGTDIKTAHILMRHKSIEMTMGYARSDDARKVDAVRKLATDPLDLEVSASIFPPDDAPLPEPREDVLARLFGSGNLADRELFGQVEITSAGDVLLAFGPYAGERLCGADQYGWVFEDDLITGRLSDADDVNPYPVSTPGVIRTRDQLLRRQDGEHKGNEGKTLGRAERRLIYTLIKQPSRALILALIERAEIPPHIKAAVTAMLSL